MSKVRVSVAAQQIATKARLDAPWQGSSGDRPKGEGAETMRGGASMVYRVGWHLCGERVAETGHLQTGEWRQEAHGKTAGPLKARRQGESQASELLPWGRLCCPCRGRNGDGALALPLPYPPARFRRASSQSAEREVDRLVLCLRATSRFTAATLPSTSEADEDQA